MEPIMATADRHGLIVVEDAAQAVGATHRNRPLGSFGQLAAVSFHETKNVSCGEGGALLINDERFVSRAEIVHEKGTDRGRFFRGQIDKYTWVDVGSSYALSDLVAAYLWAQLEHEAEITAARLRIWAAYHVALADFEKAGILRRPVVPEHSLHNAHMYYLLMPDLATRTEFIDYLGAQGVNAVFHYVPLHSSKAGTRYGRSAGSLEVTDNVSERLVRLPLWAGMTNAHVERVVAAVSAFAGTRTPKAPSHRTRLRRVS
jgi:dTDP-4-amino-4,6-dideoxygalactose transaminase